MKLLSEVAVHERMVFVRCEFNVAMDEDATVLDFTRLKASLPTLTHLRMEQAKIILCSHIGRPWGKRDPSKSLRRLLDPLEGLLKSDLRFSDDCIGPSRADAQRRLRPGEFLLLENVRYHSEENENDPHFARELVSGIELYVNDAFGNCHRPHASMLAAARAAPDRCAGFLLANELHQLQQINDAHLRPSTAIIGGAKVSGKDGKIEVIRNLLEKMDTIVVVGKIAYFFLLAKNIGVGATLTADTRGIDAPNADLNADLAACRSVIDRAVQLHRVLILPEDSISSGPGGDQIWVHDRGSLQPDRRALDIGPAAVDTISKTISESKLVVWNGPAGFFEIPAYKRGTLGIADALKSCQGRALIGGGDTIAAMRERIGDLPSRIHVCTGGGAMLTWLMGKSLAAVDALS
jgi:3-phosphoglycerate kinase